jgi:hypothetical protein
LFRLGLVAFFRLTWNTLSSKHRAAVEVVEQCADGAVPHARVVEAKRDLWARIYPRPEDDEGGIDDPERHAARTIRDALDGWPDVYGLTLSLRPSLEPAAVIRDIFGNPFRPVTTDSSWLTTTVVSLAGAIYHDRAWDRLPILADALEDAGGDNPDILAHCRGEGPHVRGCWVVDLVLGKS